jgi:hypothetical protein
MRVAGQRYMILRTHEWSDEVIEQLRDREKRKRGHRLPPKRRRRKLM